MHKIGTSGRSCAARKVVEPDDVKVTMAAAPKVWAIWRAAAVIAAGDECSISPRPACIRVR